MPADTVTDTVEVPYDVAVELVAAIRAASDLFGIEGDDSLTDYFCNLAAPLMLQIFGPYTEDDEDGWRDRHVVAISARESEIAADALEVHPAGLMFSMTVEEQSDYIRRLREHGRLVRVRGTCDVRFPNAGVHVAS